MLELAKNEPDRLMTLAKIGEQRHVSSKYLSLLIVALKQAGLVVSREGKGGGYALAKPATDISMRAIVEAVDGPLQLVRCMEASQQCPADQACSTKPIWSSLKQDIYQLLEAKNLAQLM